MSDLEAITDSDEELSPPVTSYHLRDLEVEENAEENEPEPSEEDDDQPTPYSEEPLADDDWLERYRERRVRENDQSEQYRERLDGRNETRLWYVYYPTAPFTSRFS